MSFKTNPEANITIGNSAAHDPYFCTICTTASGQARINSNDPDQQFVDIHITHAQAIHLLDALKFFLEESEKHYMKQQKPS